jgi:ribosomal protein S18 acetylase RimI-like enzyme
MLSVDARVGSRGVGRRLMDEGEAAACTAYGCRAVVLFVLNVRDDILAWYKRRGYEATGLSVGNAKATAMVEGLDASARFLVADADFVIIRKRVLDAEPAAA